VSVEDKKYGLPRIDHLRSADVAVRFLSIEPLLEDIGVLNLDGIHWAIIGGESGHRARPFDLGWARSIVSQCGEQGVPCFVKQIGRRPMDGGIAVAISDFKGGNPKEWPEDLRVREFPEHTDSLESREIRSQNSKQLGESK
jgi:protein gp37